jgi:transcriptional regulator with XRE-family HTH domain
MSIKITLNQDQINKVISSDPETYFQAFRDDNGTESVDERSTFPQNLKFYMKKNNKSVTDLVDFLSTEYPLVKSKASVQHYLSGVRTPKLSVVFAIAECLEVAPANLLPGVPGKYIDFVTNHVEMLDVPTYYEYEKEAESTETDNIDEQESIDTTSDTTPGDEVDEANIILEEIEPFLDDLADVLKDTTTEDTDDVSETEESDSELNEEVDIETEDEIELEEFKGSEEETEEPLVKPTSKELDEIDKLMASILGD